MKVFGSKRAVALALTLLGLGIVGTGIALAAVTSQQVLFPPNNAANSGAANIRIVHTVANDFDSGWHTHPGPAIVQVQAGNFKIYQGSCQPKQTSVSLLKYSDHADATVAQLIAYSRMRSQPMIQASNSPSVA